MSRGRGTTRDSDTIETLRTLIATASRLASDLVEDPQRTRWLQLYARLPEIDRDPLMDLLEREIGVRLLSHEDDAVTGFNTAGVMRTARIFARVYDSTADEREPSRDVIVRAVLRAAQVIQRPDGSQDPAIAAVLRESFHLYAADERKSVRAFLRWLVAEFDTLDGA